jgi:6-phosphogluconolactonase
VIRIFDDPGAVALAVAGRIVEIAAAGVARRGVFRIGLSGGSTPARLYETLAGAGFRGRVDWSRAVVLFADERAVPPGDPASNFRFARERLLGPAGVPPGSVHRMRAEAEDQEQAALEYEPLLREPLDLLLLGVGPDGHTASLFPGSPALREERRRVVAVTDSPWPPARRLTLTPRVIREAREVAVLVTGEGKAGAVAEALEGDVDPVALPARLLIGRDWYLDRAAAGRLERA